MEGTKLSRETIIAEALELLNEVGLDGLSLRPLAARLGVKAPSLYWHVPDKNALLAGLNEFVFARCIDAVPEVSSWREWMRAFGIALWHTQNEVRDFGRLITAADVGEQQFARTAELIRVRLRKLDMPIDQAVDLQSSVQALISGWSIFAHAPYAQLLTQFVDFDQVAMRSLDALIDGWDAGDKPIG